VGSGDRSSSKLIRQRLAGGLCVFKTELNDVLLFLCFIFAFAVVQESKNAALRDRANKLMRARVQDVIPPSSSSSSSQQSRSRSGGASASQTTTAAAAVSQSHSGVTAPLARAALSRGAGSGTGAGAAGSQGAPVRSNAVMERRR
jgi:hypothetical protein